MDRGSRDRGVVPAQLRRGETHGHPQGRHRDHPDHRRARPAAIRTHPEELCRRPTIVLVHGAFAESASWDGVAGPLLSAGHPVIAAANPLRGLAADTPARRTSTSRGGPVHPRGAPALHGGARGATAIPGASHAVPVSHPDATAQVILEATRRLWRDAVLGVAD